MKYRTLSVIITLWIISFFSPSDLQASHTPLMSELDNVDAIQAVALANKWRWTNKDIKSYVNSKEIVFKFPDGQVKRIPMPVNKMLIAVAPYITKTHT